MTILNVSILVMNRLKKTESAIFFSLGRSLLPRDLNFPELINRVTDEVVLTETALWSIFFLTDIITALKISFKYVFAITEACVVPCGSRKTSPLTISIV